MLTATQPLIRFNQDIFLIQSICDRTKQLLNALAFPDALTQQDGGLGTSIGYKVDVHSRQYN